MNYPVQKQKSENGKDAGPTGPLESGERIGGLYPISRELCRPLSTHSGLWKGVGGVMVEVKIRRSGLFRDGDPARRGCDETIRLGHVNTTSIPVHSPAQTNAPLPR
jgi:hypothetical protein